MENLPDESMEIETGQQTIDNERERERIRSRQRRNQVLPEVSAAQRDARLESERLRLREMRARESDAERSTRLEADRDYTRNIRDQESDAERSTRLEIERERFCVGLDHETPGQTSHRLNNTDSVIFQVTLVVDQIQLVQDLRVGIIIISLHRNLLHLKDKICSHCSVQLFECELKLKSACCGNSVPERHEYGKS